MKKKTTQDILKLLEPANPIRKLTQDIDNRQFITKPNATGISKHEHTHTKYGTDAIDSVLNEGALALTTRGDIVYMGATDLARLAVGNADEFLGTDGTDPSWRTAAQVLASLSSEAGAAFSINSQNITDLANAVNPTDAVNLEDVLDRIGVVLNYWISNQTLTTTLTDSEASLQETPSSTPETLTTILFKSTAVDTPTPFTVKAGTLIEVHFDADETVGAGRNEGLHCILGYVDADGTSNFTQIGDDSDSTVALTVAKTSYELHIHVPTGITVPAGKRLWLKFVATTLSGAGGYPELNVYYDDSDHHIHVPVAGSVLGAYIPYAFYTTRGDMAYQGAAVLTRLAIGNDGYVVMSDGSDPVYTNPRHDFDGGVIGLARATFVVKQDGTIDGGAI